VGGVRDLLADAETVFPGIGEYELAEMIAGLRPVSPDNLPILGPATEGGDPRVVYATGHGRNGIALTPVTAATVVADVLGRPAPPSAPAARPGRLALGWECRRHPLGWRATHDCSGGPVIVTVNGESRTLSEGSTVRALVRELDLPAEGVAVAVDGEVVPGSG